MLFVTKVFWYCKMALCSGVTIFIILRVKNFFRKADVSPWPPWLDTLCPAKFIAYSTHSQELFFFSFWLCPVAYRQRRQWQATPVLLPRKPHGWRSLVGCSWGHYELDATERLHFHFHALEKEMATHSSVLAWRTPGTGEPGGLLSMGLHRVRHDWSDLAAAAAAVAYRNLVPQPGIEPVPPAVEAQNFNHWTTGEVPGTFL